MRRVVWAVALLAMTLVVPADAQTGATELLTDDSGDVEVRVYDNPAPAPAATDPLDLLSLTVEETPDHFVFTVHTVALASCEGGACTDTADLRTSFVYGGQGYMVQMGKGTTGLPFGRLHEQGDNTFALRYLADIDVELDDGAATVTGRVPREYLLDASGSPPRRDTVLEGFITNSYGQAGFGGPDPTNPSGPPVETFVIRDVMTGDAVFPIALGGEAASGPVRLTSPAPYRASNGGQATYRFELGAVWNGTGDAWFDLEFDGVPPQWQVERPEGLLHLEPGVPADFAILVTTPFGHQHGGSDAFDARIRNVEDPETWAEVEIGVHHLAVPQPSGHHPTAYFHSHPRQEPLVTVFEAIGATAGNGYMNTLVEDPDDTGEYVQGWSSTPVQDRFYTAVCLEPGLLMGLDGNLSKDGLLTLPLASTIPLDGVVVTGRVFHLAPGEPLTACGHSLYNDREATVVAEFGPSDPTSVGGETILELPVTATADGDYIPFADGATLVVEFEAEPDNGIPQGLGAGGPAQLRMTPGGSITLPLDEYEDARPPGLIGLTERVEVQETGTQTAFLSDDVAEKESPVGLTALLLPLALALRRRR